MTTVRNDISAQLCRALTSYQVAVYEWRDCDNEMKALDAMRLIQNEINRLAVMARNESLNIKVKDKSK